MFIFTLLNNLERGTPRVPLPPWTKFCRFHGVFQKESESICAINFNWYSRNIVLDSKFWLFALSPLHSKDIDFRTCHLTLFSLRESTVEVNTIFAIKSKILNFWPSSCKSYKETEKSPGVTDLSDLRGQSFTWKGDKTCLENYRSI